MIRNVCIHVSNEQPLMCDLFAMPSASDAGLVCTNVRSLDGKRPVFIDQVGSTFFFPYHIVRFLEIPEASMVAYRARGGAGTGGVLSAGAGDDEHGAPRRGEHEVTGGRRSSGDGAAGNESGLGTGHGGGSLLPVAVGAMAPGDDDELDLDIEIDEDFLQRVRDI